MSSPSPSPHTLVAASRKIVALALACLVVVAGLVGVAQVPVDASQPVAGAQPVQPVQPDQADQVDEGDRAGRALVRADTGWVRGQTSASHLTFSGIPYAAPPVGDLRWSPPRSPQPWPGVRDATAPASPCAQRGYGSEDCLYLNVTVPRRARAGARLPVMVWLHGGGFRSGAGSEYGARPLVDTGDVVVVTVNYRLGAFGFLSSPVLDAEGHPSGSYGLQDQAAALRWVRRNVGRFGGDAGNVTLFGQSGGARSVCAHLASPGSRGLFHKAIVQSGPCANALVTKPVADQRGAQVTAELGCEASGDVAACLRSRPVDRVLDTLPGQGSALIDEYREEPWMPVVGTPVLPEQPMTALARGAGAGIPMLVGSTRDEMRSFVGFRYDAVGNPLTEAQYGVLVEEAFGPRAGEVLARYPVGDHPSPAVALATLLTDWGGGTGACPTLHTAQVAARHTRVFAYELTEDSGRVYEGFPMGSYHSWDLPFLWDLAIPGSDYPELTPAQLALSGQMVDYWTTFARTGDPNARGSVPWAELEPGDGVVQALAAGDGGIGPVPFAENHQCELWLG